MTEMTTLPAAVLVTQPQALRLLAHTLNKQEIIAVDTESNSLYAYQERVCLIQFSTLEGDYLVDPLALEDLGALGDVFANPKVEKVFHAAEYDLICLQRDFGFRFENLFDTMIAARVLGREAVGLAAMLGEHFGIEVNKRHQRADWGKRPLAAEMLAYAQQDTHYLIELSARMRAELEASGRWALAAEDFERLAHSDYASAPSGGPEEAGSGCWRVSGASQLEPQKAAVLMELCRYRDEQARLKDRPLFKIMGDKTLLAIAEACPQGLDELGRLPGMSRWQVKQHGRALLAVVKRGLAAPPVRSPRSPRPSEAYLERLEALRTWRKETGMAMGVSSDVILARDLLYSLAQKGPRTEAELAVLLEEVPWRRAHFGDRILEVLNHRGDEAS